MRLIDWIRSLFQKTPTPDFPAPQPDEPSTFGDRLIELHNVERARHRASPLKSNSKLTDVAKNQSAYCAKTRNLTHFGPHGEKIGRRVSDDGYNYAFCGENAAEGPSNQSDPTWAINQWLSSPPHRSNMLEFDFTEIGCGWADSGNTRYVVVVFGRPM